MVTLNGVTREVPSHDSHGEQLLFRADQAVDFLPLASYICDSNGLILRYNRSAAELWGRAPTPRDPAQRFCGSLRLYHPNGVHLPRSECPMADALRNGTSTRDQEVVIERPDGSRVTVSVNIDALKNGAGKIVGAINCFRAVNVPNDAQTSSDLDAALIPDPERSMEAVAPGTPGLASDGKQTANALHPDRMPLAAELAAMQRLQDVSTLLIQEEKFEALYEKILDAAVTIMRSDMACMQGLDENEDALRMLACRGFGPEFGEAFALSRPGAGTSCSAARQVNHRVVVPDVETYDLIVGTPALDGLRAAGIRAVQSTPLISRNGKLLGMISTHWRAPHQPLERDLRLLDVLARQAADLLERARTIEELRDGENRLRHIIEALPAAVYTTDAAGRITMFNKAAIEFSGRVPEIGTDSWCVTWKLFRPDGTPLPHDECPMALTLKEKRPIIGMEAVAERPDGTRVPFMPFPSPVFNAAGVLVGAINMLVDLTEIKRGQEAGARLAAIVESSHDAIIAKDLNGIVTSWNREAERLFGYTADETIGKPVIILIPADRIDEETVILERIRLGERVETYETTRQRKDGSLVEVALTVSPIKGATGRVIGASKIVRDNTEQRRAREQRELLLREMNHRVKNLFAIAGGLVSLSMRSARTLDDMSRAVQGRLQALASAHQLTLPTFSELDSKSEQTTTLKTLLQAIVGPYRDSDGNDERIFIDGHDVPIGSHAVTNIALVLHELATNAAKYGALSTPAGRVDIGWCIDQDVLLLTWNEHGGPVLDGPPENEGFGSVLAYQTVRGQFGGDISRSWRPEGLSVNVTMLLARLAR